MEKVLVVIVTYNAMKWVDRCFKSLQESTIVPDIYVVDNGSTDGTQSFIMKCYPKARFHQSETNLGFGKANNIGLRYALDNNYDFVYLLNQDAWLLPDTLDVMIRVSKANHDFGVLSPVQTTADITVMDINFEYNYSKGRLISSYLTEVDFVMAAHWLIPLWSLQEIGLFSPSFSHYGEDVNYIQRLHWFGFKAGVVTNVKAVHDRGTRKDTLEMIMYKRYIRSIVRISNPNNNPFFPLLTEPVKLLFIFIKYGFFNNILKIVNLIGLYPTLISNRKRTKKSGAFVAIM